MGMHASAVPGAPVEPARDRVGQQLAAEPPARDDRPGAPARRPETRKTPAIAAAFGTGSGAAVVFHDLASI